MKLFYTSSSPYARKLRACIRHFEWSGIEEIRAHPFQQEADVRQRNPLGKIPILEIDDQYLMDSELIISVLRQRYANEHKPDLSELKQLAICQGLLDAAVNLRVEILRKIEPDWWTERLSSSIKESLRVLDRECSTQLLNDARSHLPIALVCAFEYMQFRHADLAEEFLDCRLAEYLQSWSKRSCLTQIPFTD